MGLGVLQDRVLEHVPGTTRYFDDPDRPQIATGDEARRLKCDTSGPLPIILVPQPSDDPNDPLNWPIWRRDLILFVLSMISIFATSLGPILAANTLTLSLHYALPFTEVALLTGWYLFGVGVAGILIVASARILGKRHLFILGTILLIISCGWAGGSGRNYKSMLAARVFQGVGTAPFEALVNATVGDLYFVHERGKRMAFTNLAVFGGAFFTPILVGKITHTIGWPWTFYLEAIFCGVCLPAVIFLVPETAYRRTASLNTDMLASDDIRLYHNEKPESGLTNSNENQQTNKNPTTTAAQVNGTTTHKTRIEPGANTPKRSYLQSLSPFNGFITDDNFFAVLVRPFPLFFHPAILWACLIQGALIGWTVFIGIILAAIFLGPPLWWGEVETGYAYTGAFIGAILGFILSGALSDWSAKYMTQKNDGVYEPEFRIVLVIPQLVFGCIGLFGFGVTSARLQDYHWVWPVFFFGMEVMGMVIGAVASALYIVDAHRDIAIEAFTCLLVFKNFFSFGLTFSAYGWIVKGGIYNTFMIIGSLQIVICLLSVPMYILGKRNRSFFHRHDILKAVGL